MFAKLFKFPERYTEYIFKCSLKDEAHITNATKICKVLLANDYGLEWPISCS